MRPPHDIVFKYTHRETARLIIANCTLRIGRQLKFAGRLRPLRSSSQRTLRWREMDSNFRTGTSRSIPGVAGSSRTGEGDVGGGLHHRYRGGPSHRGFVQSASAIVAIDPGRCRVSTLQQPADIPEEQIWLELEEHAPRLPVRRAARHADAVDHDAG